MGGKARPGRAFARPGGRGLDDGYGPHRVGVCHARTTEQVFTYGCIAKYPSARSRCEIEHSLLGRLIRKTLPAPTRKVVSLPKVEPAPLPPTYGERQAIALSIEGMMSTFSMQVMDALLIQQDTLGVIGHLVEFGVYKGRSTSLISAHVRDREKFIVVDIKQMLSEEVLTKLYARPEFFLGRSEDFRNDYDVRSIRHAVRFMHVDSSHTYRTTLAEMAMIDDLLAPDGIACLDDFTNLDYSQILPAIFKYLYTVETDLTFVLVTREKGYPCRRPYFEQYGSFVLNRIVGEMAKRGNPDVTLARTDADPEYRAFFLRERYPDEESERYGEKFSTAPSTRHHRFVLLAFARRATEARRAEGERGDRGHHPPAGTHALRECGTRA